MKATLPDARTLSYRIEGPREAPCIMLAHGVALDLRVWDGFAGVMASDYRVLRYDSRGHGGSPAGSGSFTLDDLADDAVALMDTVGLAKVHFVGLSLGGMVGMGLALDHRERLESVAFCNARASATPDYRKNWEERLERVRQGGMEAIADATVSRWFTPEFPVRDPRAIAAIRQMVLATSVDGYCASAEALKGLDYERRLEGSSVRSLFLAGEKDGGAPPSVLRDHQRKTPSSRYAELPDTGHISVIENPEGFAAAILGFIREDA
ncbi:alpha/beta fold hydrolase [Mesorhizobium sp. ASY16-5R]|uniref:alpha/beta fold hydrolase n=1 Tax=Mesorhizobium sp. ASY16-5R TaxID=3445772 RepID=UPI003FA046DD